MNRTLTKAAEALSKSLADWQGNGDLPTFAVIAVLKAIRPEGSPNTLATETICQWIDSILTNQTTNPTGSGE
jgi:hypothetical protein